MSEVNQVSPALSEVDALFTSVVPTTPNVPDLTYMLQAIVNRLRTPFICDFLFANEPLHIQPFTSPEFSHASFLCELLTTRTATESLHGKRQTTLGNYLLTHRLTLNQLTLGVGVLEAAESMQDSHGNRTPSANPVFYDLRFMHDAARREILVVMDIPQTNHIIIQTSESSPDARGFVLLITFRKRELLDVIRTKPATLSVNTLLNELIGYVCTSTSRSCPTCNRDPGSGCLCYAQWVAKRRADHLFDPQLYKFSMTHDFGEYEGQTSKVLYDRGKPVSRSKLGAFVSFRGGYDDVSAQRLRNWSLTKFARGIRESPMQSLRLLGTDDSNSDVQIPDHDNDGLKTQTELSSIEALEPLLDQLNSMHIEEGDDECAREAFIQNRGYTSFLPGSAPISFDTANTGSSDSPLSSLTGIMVSSSLSTDQQSERAELFNSTMSVATNPSNADENGALSSVFDPDSLALSLPEQTMVGVDSFSLRRQSKETSILKDLQAARRRVRNRASANRSNQRKRAVRDKIATELQEMKNRCESLREDEMRLRAENMELRKWVRDLNPSVS